MSGLDDAREFLEAGMRRLRRGANALEIQAVQASATIALAQATLALVEQQRIANLISLAAHDPGKQEAYWRTLLSIPLDEHSLALRDDIREGLGIS